MGMLAEVRNGAAEEDWRWDLNPGAASLGDHSAGAEKNHRFLFLRYSTPDWAEGEGRIVHLWEF